MSAVCAPGLKRRAPDHDSESGRVNVRTVGHCYSMSWTDVAQAVAATIGAIGTPAALLISVRSLRWQQKNQVADEARKQLEQAMRVVIETNIRDWPTIDGTGTYKTVVAAVRNLSGEPLYDVSIQWRLRSQENFGSADHRSPLLPGDSWEQAAPLSAIHRGPFEDVDAYVTFFDSERHGWAKSRRGMLVSLREAITEGW